jgi:hypothetical protein
MDKRSFTERVSTNHTEAEFLFTLERIMAENGFTILERAIDSTEYRFIVTWLIPNARQQYWLRQARFRFNGAVVVSKESDDWLVSADFGTYEDQEAASLKRDFVTYIVQPLQAQLPLGVR